MKQHAIRNVCLSVCPSVCLSIRLSVLETVQIGLIVYIDIHQDSNVIKIIFDNTRKEISYKYTIYCPKRKEARVVEFGIDIINKTICWRWKDPGMDISAAMRLAKNQPSNSVG